MSMYPIATYTVGSGGSSSVTFSSIPQTFTHLQLRSFVRDTGSSTGVEAVKIQYNSDTGNNYVRHAVGGDGSSAFAASATSINYNFVALLIPGGYTANLFSVGIADILDYTNTNKNKTTRAIVGQDTNNGGAQEASLHSGIWLNTSAITSITLTPTANNFAQYSTFQLYGITTA